MPEGREALYADAIDLLLDSWESPKVVYDAQGNPRIGQPGRSEWLKADREKVRALLNGLAYKAHACQPELLATADVAERELVGGLMRLTENPEVKPKCLVEYLNDRAASLLPRGIGVYTLHRTFQEYLARHLNSDPEFADTMAGWYPATLPQDGRIPGKSRIPYKSDCCPSVRLEINSRSSIRSGDAYVVPAFRAAILLRILMKQPRPLELTRNTQPHQPQVRLIWLLGRTWEWFSVIIGVFLAARRCPKMSNYVSFQENFNGQRPKTQ